MKKNTMIRIILVSGLLFISPKVWADGIVQLKQQVQTLQNRVGQLENQLAARQQVAMPAPVQSVLPVAKPVYDQWYDPFAQMMMIDQQMEHNMHQAFANTGMMNPRMDMKQTKDQYIITMDIPGMDRDKINIETKEGMLTISGERRSETENNKNNQFYRQERSFGSFMQAIPLPDDAKKDHIEAKYKDGVLTVTVPRMKKEEKKSVEQKIMVK